MRWTALLSALALTMLPLAKAEAFCGFYVARADTQLYNQASKVVLVHEGRRTTITMATTMAVSVR